MRIFQEITEEEGKEMTPRLKVKSSEPFKKDIFVKEISEMPLEPTKSVSKGQLADKVEKYLNKRGILNNRYELGKIYADGLRDSM